MRSAPCPHCSALLSPGEIADGSCPSCRHPLTVPATAGRAEATPAAGVCDLCGRHQPRLGPCCLVVIGQKLRVVDVAQRWVNVRCRACSPCFQKARSLQTARYGLLAVMFGLPLAGFVTLGLTVDVLEQSLGVSRNVTGMVILATLAISLLPWLFGPLYIRVLTRRRLTELLRPSLNERLKSLVRVRDWGWKDFVTARREPRAGESALELRTL